jgi:addiction module HigA family antidote
MDEYQLNPFSLAKAIKLSPSGVRQLVIGRTKISVSTALRLAKLFDKPAVYWLDLQREAELDDALKDKELQDVLKTISKAKKTAAPARPKTSEKSGKKASLSDKRKKAAKVPGAKSSRESRSKSRKS